jgi:ComF family protein
MLGISSKRRFALAKKSFRFLYWYFIDLFFPPRCVQCHSVGQPICPQCFPLIQWIGAPFCSICGQPLGTAGVHTCIDTRLLRRIQSAAVFSGPMRRSIHALKYYSDRSLAHYLVDISFSHFSSHSWEADLILPVPLGSQREAQRGYNQSFLLAEALSLKTCIPLDAKCISRRRETRSQVGLSLEERKQNVENAFSASSVKSKKVLLVDDVCTTGATLQSCASSLVSAGAESVAALTLARAILPVTPSHSHA